MKKRILICAMLAVLILLMAGCECNHSWQEANCTTAKTCKRCDAVEGEPLGHTWNNISCTEVNHCSVCNAAADAPLGHDWQEATTEAPKTCARCQLTEGDKLITDARFTTASTKELQGTWFCELNFPSEALGLGEGLENGVDCVMKMQFGNTGERVTTVELQDEKAFMEDYRAFVTQLTYDMLSQQGIKKDDADKSMQDTYGLTVEEYVDTILNTIDMNALFQALGAKEVYYVQDGQIYTALSWKSKKFEGSKYTLKEDGNALTVDVMTLADGSVIEWTRLVDVK